MWIKVKKPLKNYLFILLIILVSSCDSYNQLLKSNDFELKYKEAVRFYNEKKYFKALPLFEELVPIYKGTEKAEEIYYYYCQSEFLSGNYILASYHFKNFANSFPNSTKAEEADFKYAYCLFKESPEFSLDQTNTSKAIDAFQLFLNKHPETQKQDEVNELVGTLRNKLEKKAFTNAFLYYKMEDYKAASVSFRNILTNFPDIENREDIRLYILKSNFKLASNSINSKKEERFLNTIIAFEEFKEEFGDSKKIKEAQKIKETASQELDKIKNKKL